MRSRIFSLEHESGDTLSDASRAQRSAHFPSQQPTAAPIGLLRADHARPGECSPTNSPCQTSVRVGDGTPRAAAYTTSAVRSFYSKVKGRREFWPQRESGFAGMFSTKMEMMRPIFLRSAATTLLPWLLVCSAFAQKSGRVEDGIKLALPFQTWGVRLDNPGAVVEYREMKSGRQAYLLASHPKNGITVSITIENVSQPPEPGECRRSLEARKDSFGAPSGLRFSPVTGKSRGSEMPPSADVMEFLLDQNEFAALRQKNFLVCLIRDNAFIDIHMSKVNFVPADLALILLRTADLA